MRDFDDILEMVGPFGPFQITVFILVSIFETPTAWAMFLHVFIAADQPWTCSSLPKYNQTANRTSEDVVILLSENLNTHEQISEIQRCELVANNTCGDILFTGDFTTIISEWNLICDLDYVKSVIMTFQMIGVLVGALVIGQLADIYGRRNIYFIVYTLLLLVLFGSSFANSWQLFAICRSFIGALIGGTMVVNFVLPLEMVGRKWRTFCGCIGFWACGVMLLALLAYLIRGWRVLSVICAIVGLPVLFSYWHVPESPRWLIQKGKLKEAEIIIRFIAKRNNRPDPDLSQLMASIKKEEKSWCSKVKLYGFWDLCRNFSMTKNTIIMMYAWFVSSAVYYGTSLNVGNLSGDRYINFFLSGLVEIPALLLVVYINNKIGRRKTLALLMSVAGVSCFLILFLNLAGKSEEMFWLTTLLAMIGKSGISGGWAAAQVFAAEVFPTVIRNIGVGVSSMSARVGGILAPQIVALNKLSKPLPFLIFGVLGILCALLSMLLPETFNMPLPDVIPPRHWCHCCTKTNQAASGEVNESALTDVAMVSKVSLNEMGVINNATATSKHDSVDPGLLNHEIGCSSETSTQSALGDCTITVAINRNEAEYSCTKTDKTHDVYVIKQLPTQEKQVFISHL